MRATPSLVAQFTVALVSLALVPTSASAQEVQSLGSPRGPDSAPAGASSAAPAPSAPPPTRAAEPAVDSRSTAHHLADYSALREPLRYELPNGLTVVLDPLPTRREVAVCVTYHVGSRDQPQGWTGLAHLTEHLMFRGSAHVAQDGYWRTVERLGSTERNATTTSDDTTYYAVVPATHLESLLYLEADRMGFLLSSLSEADVDAQRLVVARERAEREALHARSGVPFIIQSLLWPEGHPYRALQERPEDLDAIHLPHVQSFVQTWYAPDNATLSISGGFDTAAVRAMVERWFGGLRRSGPRHAAPVATIERLGAAHDVLLETHVPVDELHIYWATPPFGADGDAELDVAARILERRLRERLVETGTVLEISAGQSSRDLASDFSVGAAVPAGRSTAEVLAVVEEEVLRLATQTPDAALVSRYVLLWIDATIARLETVVGRAEAHSSRFRSFPDGHWSLRADRARYEQITPERVQQTVAHWLAPDRRLAIHVRARADAPEGGVILGHTAREATSR